MTLTNALCDMSRITTVNKDVSTRYLAPVAIFQRPIWAPDLAYYQVSKADILDI